MTTAIPISDPDRPRPPRTFSRRHLFGAGQRDATEPLTSWIRVHRRAMACRFEVVLSAKDTRFVADANEMLGEADRLEASLTVFRETSDLVHINRTAASEPVPVSGELFDLLTHCAHLHAATSGAFDVTSTPLSRCWGFLKREGRLPAPDAIDRARSLVGMDAVALDPLRRTVRFTRPGIELNLGSIGKGFAVQSIADRLAARGVEHALVSAGASSVLALGGRGRGWVVDVTSRQASRRLARLRLRNCALGTSGAGEQFIEVEGRRYGHVLDPRTGWPASGVLSASVVTTDAASADALATAFFIGGLELAREYCATHERTLALITPEDGAGGTVVVGEHDGAIVEDV
jgi:thiamine biosynthesis lipoprotein